MCNHLGVLQFAGITLDSVRQEGRLPEGKLRTCCAMLQNFHDQARLSVCLKELTPVTDRFIEFYMPRGCLGSSFSASHDRSYQRRRQDHLTFYLQRMSIPLFALLQSYISIVISGEIAPGHFYVTLIKLPFLFTNSMSHFSSADLTVVWTAVGTRVIAFALAARAMPLKKVIPMRKFVLLVAGNPTHLKFIWGRKFFTLISWFAHLSKVGQAIGLLLGGLGKPFLTKLLVAAERPKGASSNIIRI